jgi:hypothetical protein
MPEEIVAALARVASALPEVRWLEPEEIRHTARIRQRRRGVAAAFVAVLMVAGGVGLVRTVHLPHANPGNSRPSDTATPAPTCPNGLVPARVALPELRDIRVNVHNGSSLDGLAADVGGQLRNRGLAVLKVDTAVGGKYEGTARITYGPSAVGAAWVMRSFFADQAESVFDIERRGDEVDVTVGTNFQQLSTPAELNQSIALLGRAHAPPGTCQVD